MNMLAQFSNTEQSMTSLEVAELCQKRHDNVKRLIDNLINQQVIACPQIEVVQNTYVQSVKMTGEKYLNALKKQWGKNNER